MLEYLTALLLLFVSLWKRESAPVCRNIPGDTSWPSLNAWSELNETVGGRLLKTVPIASPCYDLGEQSSECQRVRDRWHWSSLHVEHPTSVMSDAALNRTCDPFILDGGCTNGAYVEYSVKVSAPSDIIAALKFAKERNIRFVVKNTGHDYMGKSTGHGALAVWTHHIQDTTWMDTYSSEAYTGPAVKMQAGAQIKDLYREASKRGYVIVAGLCPTIGYAGGFLQGGGNGPLTGVFGLAADNTLEFEVITTDGRFINASPTQNADLFWALSGGGGGTYAVVWSATIKLHRDMPVTGMSLFTSTDEVTPSIKWKGVEAYRKWTTELTSVGGFALAYVAKDDFMVPFAITPNKSLAEFSSLLKPLLNNFTQLGIPYKVYEHNHPGYYQVYNTIFPDLEVSDSNTVQNTIRGGRLLSRQWYQDPIKMRQISDSIQSIVNDGVGMYELSVSPPNHNNHGATLPQWRSLQTLLAAAYRWNNTATAEEVEDAKMKMNKDWMPKLYEVTPGGGAYLNEADPQNKNWKEDYYGVNYDKLLQIKQKYDPDFLLYGGTAVGGDLWVEQPDRRLCRQT